MATNNILWIGIIIASVAGACGKVCYTCGYDPSTAKVEGCGEVFIKDSNKESNWQEQCNEGCYTVQFNTTNGGDSHYQRGCVTDLTEPCVDGPYEYEHDGTTYHGHITCCEENKCNGELGSTSSRIVAAINLILAMYASVWILK